MQAVIDRPIKAWKVDRYYVRLDLEWMGGSSISAAAVIGGDDDVLTIGAVDIEAEEIGFMVTGVSPGVTSVHIDITLSDGRTDCKSVAVYCDDC